MEREGTAAAAGVVMEAVVSKEEKIPDQEITKGSIVAEGPMDTAEVGVTNFYKWTRE